MPPTNLACSSCGHIEAGFRCLDCYGSHWWCRSCLIARHAQHPFHRPEQWKDNSFEHVSLCDLGYIFILGHSSSGCSCSEDDNLFGDHHMRVIHVNGVSSIVSGSVAAWVRVWSMNSFFATSCFLL